MSFHDAARFHRLYGPVRQRIAYASGDFLDYVLMLAICLAAIALSYGPGHWITTLGALLCAFMVCSFPLRNGLAMSVPVLLRRPQELLYTIAYKLQNIQPMYLAAVGVLVLDNLLIRHTPMLLHRTMMMRELALAAFYGHFALISAYRTVIFCAHLRRRDLVLRMLSDTSWRSALTRQPNVTIHIVHAYFTGLLTHIVLLAPWYIVITHCQYSLLTMPVVLAVDVLIHARYLRGYARWFYRDHWLGHNSEFEFLYLHGTHHDAIPCGLIGVSGNGYLEGFLRHALGNPCAFYSPLVAIVFYSLDVLQDIKSHQYIPGIFPRLTRRFHEVSQHSTHHFSRLVPYGIALKVARPAQAKARRSIFRFAPDEILNSVELDERLNGFEWENRKHQRFLELFDKYQGR